MKGTTILTAYTKARVFTYESDSFDGDRIDRAVRQKAMFESALLFRLNAYDAAMDARVAERFMSQAMESAVTDFDFFAAVVNRINLDAVKIAALEASNTEQAQMLADGFADAKEQSTRLAEARESNEALHNVDLVNRTENNRLRGDISDLRAEVARRTSDLDAARNTIAELDSERNGANAFLDEVAFILKVPPAYMGGMNGWAQVKMGELSSARAEAERLRPAAEAWEAREALISTSSAWRDASPDDEIRTYQAMQAADEKLAQAAARARAAKVTQP